MLLNSRSISSHVFHVDNRRVRHNATGTALPYYSWTLSRWTGPYLGVAGGQAPEVIRQWATLCSTLFPPCPSSSFPLDSDHGSRSYIYINSAAFSIFRFQFTNPREPSLLGANLVLFVAWNLSGPRRKGGTTTFAFSRRRVTRWFSSHLNMKLEKERRGEEGNVWWGKQVTISGGGTMRGIVRPVRIRRAPSVGQWSSMRIYRSWRTGWPCKREISHPSHGVEGFFFKEGVAHFARKRRKTYMLFLPRIFRLEFLQRNATRSLVTGNGAMKRRKPKCMMHTLYVGQKCKGLFWLTSPFLGDRVFDWWDWPRLVRGCTFSYYVNKA